MGGFLGGGGKVIKVIKVVKVFKDEGGGGIFGCFGETNGYIGMFFLRMRSYFSEAYM